MDALQGCWSVGGSWLAALEGTPTQLDTPLLLLLLLLLLLQSLWRRMCSTPEGCRHFYEVIQEGHPCHLYFDLEYSTASNPGRDGAALVGCLCRLLQDMCRRLWGLTLLPQVRGGRDAWRQG
jgi:hypothetical protein